MSRAITGENVDLLPVVEDRVEGFVVGEDTDVFEIDDLDVSAGAA